VFEEQLGEIDRSRICLSGYKQRVLRDTAHNGQYAIVRLPVPFGRR